MRLRMRLFYCVMFFCLVGCQRYGLLVHRQKLDVSTLASTHVGTPDPRQKCPPFGQMLVVDWWIPKILLEKQPRLLVHMLFYNYTEKVIEYPLLKCLGYETYSICGAEFEETGGLLTYKAEIVTCDGEVFREWEHQMWVQLIQIQEGE